jgi:hypothetical protein
VPSTVAAPPKRTLAPRPPHARGKIPPRNRTTPHVTVFAAARTAIRRKTWIDAPDAQHAPALVSQLAPRRAAERARHVIYAEPAVGEPFDGRRVDRESVGHFPTVTEATRIRIGQMGELKCIPIEPNK